MAVSTIERKTKITYVEANAQGTVTSANGYVNVTLTFTPPERSQYIGTIVRTIGASSSVNDIKTFASITDSETSSVYRVVSTSAQTVTIYARKLYLTTH